MLQQKMNNIKKFIENFGKKRLEAQDIMPNKVFESLYLMEVFKVGNCSENAVLAELVLKMNNIRNACCATMFKAVPGDSCCDWRDLDHAVCVFNKDGSLFNGKKTKHTILFASIYQNYQQQYYSLLVPINILNCHTNIR